MRRFVWVLCFAVFVISTGHAIGMDEKVISEAGMATADEGFQAADCCRVIVKGCGKTAKVCVPAGCSIDTQRRARTAFERAYSCKSTNVSSYIGTCSGEKCEIDLR